MFIVYATLPEYKQSTAVQDEQKSQGFYIAAL